MELSLIALLLGILAGALGGFIYWLIPTRDEQGNIVKEPPDMIIRRIIIGAIVGGVSSPILMTVPMELTETFMGLWVGIVALGWAGIDVLKTLLKMK